MKTTSNSQPPSPRVVIARKHATAGPKLETPLSLSASIFSEIEKEHAIFRKDMERIQNLYDNRPETAKSEYLDFRIRLHAHAQAEEDTLYPALLEKTRPLEKLDNEVREGKEEHHVADLLIDELDQIAAADVKWKAKFKVLCESIEHHLDEEEEHFEKLWKKNLTKTEDAAVLEHFLRRRGALVAQAAEADH